MGQNRRKFIHHTVASVGLLGLSNGMLGMINSADEKKLKIVYVGGHPDDPESGCGGTLAKYSAAGHCLGDQTHIFHPTDYVDITEI
jgi:hypothetical protein